MEIFGYTFNNGALLEEALTVPSYRMDHPEVKDNQRLEFLGDAVLGFLSAERLYGEFPNDPEGALTVRRTHLVSTAALCAAVEDTDFVSRLRQSWHAAKLNPHSKIIADAVEAVLGAAYLDGGMDAARCVYSTLNVEIAAENGVWQDNPKGELQVRAQALVPPQHPIYTKLSTAGKAHNPLFTVKVEVEGIGEAIATSGTIKGAEAAAARKLLNQSRGEVRVKKEE